MLGVNLNFDEASSPLFQSASTIASQLSGATTLSSSSETTPPSNESTPPSSETTPPSNESTPPSSETTPPSNQTTPHSNESTPPSSETTSGTFPLSGGSGTNLHRRRGVETLIDTLHPGYRRVIPVDHAWIVQMIST